MEICTDAVESREGEGVAAAGGGVQVQIARTGAGVAQPGQEPGSWRLGAGRWNSAREQPRVAHTGVTRLS